MGRRGPKTTCGPGYTPTRQGLTSPLWPDCERCWHSSFWRSPTEGESKPIFSGWHPCHRTLTPWSCLVHFGPQFLTPLSCQGEAQGEDVTLLHDAVKATFAAGVSTTFGVILTPIQTYNAAKVACVAMDVGLKLSVSPRFWWTFGSTAGRVLLASPGILWDVIGWGGHLGHRHGAVVDQAALSRLLGRRHS